MLSLSVALSLLLGVSVWISLETGEMLLHEMHAVLAEAVVCHLCLESSGSTKTESNVSQIN